MNYRELFNNIMHYGSFDRMPVIHWQGWPETHKRWQAQGFPEDLQKACDFLDADPMPYGIPIHQELYPWFEEKTIEETEQYRIFRQADGVIAQHWKNRSCIPHFVDYILKDRKGWKEYKKRLQPDRGRIPANIKDIARQYNSGNIPVSIGTGSLVGWVRNWMGVENMSYLFYDDPMLFAEMVDTISDLICWCMDQVLPDIKADMGWGWEDICFRTGPLVSPDIFKKYVVPGYKKISKKLHSYGCDLYVVDCDGKIDDLVPLWLDAGVNVQFPVEIGAWQADPMAFRKKYGKDLRIIGGINKLVLEKSKKDIDDEIDKRKPLMEQGGFISLPDHLITPDTPLENYR